MLASHSIARRCGVGIGAVTVFRRGAGNGECARGGEHGAVLDRFAVAGGIVDQAQNERMLGPPLTRKSISERVAVTTSRQG
jgi:hypothetical protein